MYKSLQKEIKELKEKDRMREEENKELKKEIEKMKTQNTSELEGINSILSNYAQHAIDSSKGPLKPDELLQLLTNDIFGKGNKDILTIIRNYSKNIDGVKKQLLQVFETLQIHISYRKKQKELDDKLIKRLKKLQKTIEKEEEKEIKSGTKLKVQSTLEQYWGNFSYKVEINYNKDQNSSVEEVEQTNTSKEEILEKKGGKYSRKRKSRPDDDSSSSQENGVMQITSRFSKRLKINSSKSTTESSNSTEFISVQESDDPAEPMSVASSESSQSSTQPMSISESSQSDAMSVDDSSETTERTKTAKKTGKSFKQSEENAPQYNGEVETVPERRFYLRGNPL